MFVHSLWSETAAPLAALAESAGQLLGVPVIMSERSAELAVIDQAEEVSGPDVRWHRPVGGGKSPGELRPLWLYVAGSATGIASVNPSLNFWLRDQLSEYIATAGRPLRLRWTGTLPDRLAGWQLSAMHLQHQSARTDVIIQGQAEPGVLIREADRLPDYNVAGMSLADPRGRIMTLYDEGQVWLQQVDPDDIPGLMATVILPLFGRG